MITANKRWYTWCIVRNYLVQLFVDNLLAGGLSSMRSSVLACYVNFHNGVCYSAAIGKRTLACVDGWEWVGRSGGGWGKLNLKLTLPQVEPEALCERGKKYYQF